MLHKRVLQLTKHYKIAIMELNDIGFQGLEIGDGETLSKLPEPLRNLLAQINGFVQFGGGLHIRGACLSPTWHSLREAWSGENALCKLFPAVLETDIPFGQDVMGDQFVLRENIVYRLHSETGKIESLNCDFFAFLNLSQNDPLEFLQLHPLLQFQNEGGTLQPGELLSAYPPFCTVNAQNGVSLRANSAQERIAFLASFAAQISSLPDGTAITLQIV